MTQEQPSIQTKICGLTTKEAIDAAVVGGAAYLGFVFYPRSPRHIDAKEVTLLTKTVPERVKKVGVVVDMNDAELERLLDEVSLDFIQCHGEESPERVAEIKERYHLPVIKAIAIRADNDVEKARLYESVADMLLFDSKIPHTALPGGNGLAFDWQLLAKSRFALPWFLSGGLNRRNISDAISITHARYLDVSSGLEHVRGKKDPQMVRDFLSHVAEVASAC